MFLSLASVSKGYIFYVFHIYIIIIIIITDVEDGLKEMDMEIWQYSNKETPRGFIKKKKIYIICSLRPKSLLYISTSKWM